MNFSPLAEGFSAPSAGLHELLEAIGTKLFSRDRTLSQYVGWSLQEGLVEVLGKNNDLSIQELGEVTALTEAGIESLLGVLCALRLVTRSKMARYALTPLARDYLLKESPFFIGGQLECRGFPMPGSYRKGESRWISRLRLKILSMKPEFRVGGLARLENQHARNLAACAAAVKSGEFSQVRCVFDVAGGSGTFSIPFALQYPEKRVVLGELPTALAGAKAILARHGLENRVELVPMDALSSRWNVAGCDGVFVGNFLHGFDDEDCIGICRAAFDLLPPGGHVWIHEMLWRETRDGPLITALWNAAMRGVGSGRQRTGSELSEILSRAGFSDIRSVATAGAFAMVTGRKPS